MIHGPLTRYTKLRVAHAPGMPGKLSPPPTSEETPSERSRHASRHVHTHVLWCNSGSLTRMGGETFPAFPAHAQPAILRICKEAHGISNFGTNYVGLMCTWFLCGVISISHSIWATPLRQQCGVDAKLPSYQYMNSNIALILQDRINGNTSL